MPLFLAYITVGGAQLFSVGELGPDGKLNTFGWKKRGEFAGELQIKEYVNDGDMLLVERKSGELLKLYLKHSQTLAAKAPPLSRAEANAFLNTLLNSAHKSARSAPVKAKLDFDAERTATPAQKTQIAEMREAAKATGTIILVVRREDGMLVIHETPPMPKANLPTPVRAALAEEDWERFNVAYAAANLQAAENRKASKRAKQ